MPIDEQKIILNLQNNLEHKPITEEDLPGVSRIGLLSDDTLHFEYDPVTVYGKRPDMIDNTIGMPTKGIRDKALNGLALGVAGVMTLPVIAEIGGGLAATEMGPVILSNIGRFGWKVLNHPITQTIGTIDGFRNLLSGNGVQKTYNHFKNGEYVKGALSLAGDVLDASPLIGVGKAIKSGNEVRKIFGNGVGLNYTLNEMPILNLFNRDNRVGFELAKIPFQEPIYRTGYHVTRYAGDEAPYLFPDEYVDNLGNKIKLDNYNPVRNPDDNLPVNTYWRGGDDINYTTARPEIGLHVGATESPGRILMSRQHYGPERTIPPVVREVTWIDYPNSTRTMSDMNRWIASSENKKLWEDIGVTIDDSMLEDDLYKPFNWYYDNSTTRNIEALNRSNALLNGLRRAGITSIQYGNKYEIPWGWKHIDGNFYSTPAGRKIEWPGGESHAIITPESWWSKNRRYTPPVPDQDEVIPFDQYVRNND